jgi:hypothetical protein
MDIRTMMTLMMMEEQRRKRAQMGQAPKNVQMQRFQMPQMQMQGQTMMPAQPPASIEQIMRQGMPQQGMGRVNPMMQQNQQQRPPNQYPGMLGGIRG